MSVRQPGPDQNTRAVVLVPAHNEAESVAAGLTCLVRRAEPHDFRVVVVCNGCTDATADRARAVAATSPTPVDVLEIDVASKPAALRAAEAVASGFPRVYLDADVLCPTDTARALIHAVRDGADVAVPARVLDLAGASRLARMYFTAWADLPWVRAQLAGRGAYALSESARASFGEFPDVLADDRYATTRVPRDRAVVLAAPLVIRPPQRLRGVVRVRSRVYAGNVIAEAPTHDATWAARARVLGGMLRRPAGWPALGIFLATTLVAKAMATKAVRDGNPTWTRDALRGAGYEALKEHA